MAVPHYEMALEHAYDMSDAVSVPDLGWKGNRNPGTGSNITGVVHGAMRGSALEFNGNSSVVNLGDVAMLNAVSAFTIAFWMNQDVLDVTDAIFDKGGWGVAESGITILTSGGGQMYLQIDGSNQRGIFDYSLVVNVGQWQHLAVVFNGAGVGNTGRLQAYVDASPVALTYTGTIPAATDDLSGIDATIGRATASFDGKLDAFRFYSIGLSPSQIADLYAGSLQGRIHG